MKFAMQVFGQRQRINAVAAAAAITSCLTISACSGDSDAATDADSGQDAVTIAADQAKAAGYDFQYDVLSDGAVESTEYREAVDRFLSCMRESSIETSDPRLNLSDSLQYSYELTVPSTVTNTQFQAVQDECESKFLRLTEDTYLATHTARTDTALMTAVQACLKADGVAVTGEEVNFAELQDAPADATADQLSNCVTAAGNELYPGVPIPFAFN